MAFLDREGLQKVWAHMNSQIYKKAEKNKEELTSYLNDELAKRDQLAEETVKKQQGSANVGKILVVGADGNLALADMPNTSGDVVGFVDSSNNIVLTGMLATGEYTVKYEMDDGTVQNIGIITVGASTDSPTYTNLFVPSTAQINMRLSSSNTEKAQNGTFLTDYIDLGDVMASGGKNILHGKGFRFDNEDSETVTYVHYYDADKTMLGYEDYHTPIKYKTDADGNPYHTLDATKTTARYVRITGLVSVGAVLTENDIAGIIITLNELIGA